MTDLSFLPLPLEVIDIIYSYRESLTNRIMKNAIRMYHDGADWLRYRKTHYLDDGEEEDLTPQDRYQIFCEPGAFLWVMRDIPVKELYSLPYPLSTWLPRYVTAREVQVYPKYSRRSALRYWLIVELNALQTPGGYDSSWTINKFCW